ncbi:MAG: OmpH family outer membrane protein [Bradymonadales bacterium]|nr:MAG: OmpH family outer membrane protein [Bradymonadales bacterium]
MKSFAVFLIAGMAFAGQLFYQTEASRVSADEASGPSIMLVDFQKALNEVAQGKKAMQELEAESKTRREALSKAEEELEKLRAELEKLAEELQNFQRNAAAGALSDEARGRAQRRQQEFMEKQMLFQQRLEAYGRAEQEAQEVLRQKEFQARTEIVSRLRSLVSEMGRKKDNVLILETNESGFLFASSFVDITDQVIQEYDKRHKVESAGSSRRRGR